MKLYLLALAVLAVCQVCVSAPAFSLDREYHYKYEGRVVTGVAGDVKQFSGFGVKSKGVIQNQGKHVYFKFHDEAFGEINDQVDVEMNEEFPMKYIPAEAATDDVASKEAINMPVRAVFVNGLVESFDVYANDPEWSVNLKRAALSMFQLDLSNSNPIRNNKESYTKEDDNAHHYRVMEKGYGGECETIYTVRSVPDRNSPNEHVLNVTKLRNYDNCLHRPTIFSSPTTGYQCDTCKKTDVLQIVSTTDYHLRGDRRYYTIEKLNNVAKYLLTPYGPNSDTIITGINQTAVLTGTAPITEPIKFNQPFVTYNSLLFNTSSHRHTTTDVDLTKPNYYNNLFEYKYPDYKAKVGKYLEDLSHDHELTEDFIEKGYAGHVAQLIKIFGSLSLDEIKDLYQTHMNYDYQTATPEKQRQKTIFYDVLSMTGTNPSVLFTIHALKNNFLPQHVSSRYFARLAFHVKEHSEALIDHFYEYTVTIDGRTMPDLYKTFWLSFGTLVSRGCQQDQHHDKEHYLRTQTCQNYARKVYENFVMATSEWEKLVHLKVLGNMALPHSYHHVKRVVDAENDYSPALRLQALYSLFFIGESQSVHNEILSVMHSIYSNHSEPINMRLAAFEYIVNRDPSYNVLQSIADDLEHEPSHQVSSYVYSTFRAFANSTNPCHKLTSEITTRILQNIPEYFYGYYHSQNFKFNYYNDKYHFGTEAQFAYIGSNESIIPDEIFYLQTGTIYGYNVPLFETKIKTTGLSRLFKHIHDLYDHNDDSKSLLNLFRRASRSVDTNKKEQDEIRNLLNIVNRGGQPIDAGINMWVNSKEVSFARFTDKDLKGYLETGHYSLPKEMPAFLQNGFDMNTYKTDMLVELSYEIPTESGFPLGVHIQYPGFTSVQGKVKFDVQPGFFSDERANKKPSTVKMSYEAKVMSHYKGIGQVAILTPLLKNYGVGFHVDSTTKMPIKFDVEYDIPQHKFHINWKPSQIKYEPMTMKIYPFTFIDMRTNHVPASKEEQSKPIHYRENPHEVLIRGDPTYFGTGFTYREQHEYPWTNFGTIYKMYMDTFGPRDRYGDVSSMLHRIIPGFYHMQDYGLVSPVFYPLDVQLTVEPDKNNPVTEYDLTIDYEKYKKTATQERLPQVTGEKIVLVDDTFRRVKAVHVDLVAKGPTERKYHYDYIVSHDNDDFVRKVSLKYNRSSLPGYDSDPFSLCLNAGAKLPSYDEWYAFEQHIEKKAEVTYNINFGKDCSSDHKIDAKVTVERSDEEKYYDEDITRYPTYETCQKQQQDGYNATDECWEIFMNYYSLRKYTAVMHYENLPQGFVDFMTKLAIWHDYSVFTNIESYDFYAKNPAGQIKSISNYSMYEPTADAIVYAPYGTVFYKDVYYPKFTPWLDYFHLRYDQDTRIREKIFGSYERPMCTAEKNIIHTYDDVAYKFDAPKNCYYVLSKDCSEKNQFTVLVKEIEHATVKKALKVFIHNQKIEILPLDATQPPVLRINDVMKPFNQKSVYLFQDPKNPKKLLFRITRLLTTYYIESHVVDIDVIYNGVYVGVMVSNAYRGITCGLGGDNNGEATNDFVGPKGCVHHDAKSFGYSYVVPDGSCQIPATVSRTCDAPATQKQTAKCTIRRNKVIHDVTIGARPSSVCFSNAPIPQCAEGCKVASGYNIKRKVAFHCLNTSDRSTSDLINRSKTEPIELQKKSEDYYEVIEYPEKCVPQ